MLERALPRRASGMAGSGVEHHVSPRPVRLSLSAHAQFEDVLPALGVGVRRRRAAPLCRADRAGQLPARTHAQHAAVPQAGDRPGLLFHQLADEPRADPPRHQRLAAGGDDDSGRADGDGGSALLAGGLSERGRGGLRRRRAGDRRDRRRARRGRRSPAWSTAAATANWCSIRRGPTRRWTTI